MANTRNQLIVAELDQMANSLESKGNSELASLIDEVSASLLSEGEPVVAKAPKAPKAKPAKSNAKRRKKAKKKMMTPPKHASLSRSDAKKLLKAAKAELLDMAGELISAGNLKEARNLLRYAEEVKDEEVKYDMPMLPPEAPKAEDEEVEETEEEEGEDEEAEETEEGSEESEDSDEYDGAEEESEDEEAESMDEATDEVSDEDVEAMLRKYEELYEDDVAMETEACDMPTEGTDAADEVAKEEPKEKEDEGSEDEDKEKESKEEKLMNLAKKLAAAGEVKLAYDITELLDRK
jgi:hypothetical protein